MSRVVELPDDFDETQDLNQTPDLDKIVDGTQDLTIGSALANNETPFGIKKKEDGDEKTPVTGPALPPSMESVRSYTSDEILDMINKTPLFMSDIDKAMEGEENDAIEAMKSLQAEGTRADIAQGLRENGNELTRAKRYADGRDYYTQAIGVLLGPDKWSKGEDPEADAKAEKEILEACYANRAMCNLELKNYRSTTLDCAQALKLNPRNIKAYYRSSTALLKVDRIEQAEDACSRGLALDPSNKSLKLNADKIAKRKAYLADLAAKKKAEEDRRRKEELVLKTALRARGIRTRETEQPPHLEDAVMHLDPDPVSPTSSLVFPCVLLYPMDAQSDFIKAFHETQSIADHLSYIFPLPWDSAGEYTTDKVDCYMETTTGGLIKAGKKLSLLKILSGGKVEVVDDMVTINVVPTSKSSKFIEEFKARKAAEKKA
ncbi:hypothetical protein KEM56_006823 [Ascosphaera pollenicola]|nr:hypothetical protein KEM56_006823 [Ascosphaera pollenicola]